MAVGRAITSIVGLAFAWLVVSALPTRAAEEGGGTPNPIEHVVDQEVFRISGFKMFTKYAVLEVGPDRVSRPRAPSRISLRLS